MSEPRRLDRVRDASARVISGPLPRRHGGHGVRKPLDIAEPRLAYAT